MNDLRINNEKISFSAFDLEFCKKQSRNELLIWISEIKKKYKNVYDLQFFRSNSLISYDHLRSAIWHAWKAFEENYSISNNLSVEFMLYISGQRQISKAIEIFGIENQENQLSLVIFHSRDLNFNEIQNLIVNKFDQVKITKIKFSNSYKKLKSLSLLFNYDLNKENNLKDDDILKLEKLILSCVSNLVFEG